MKSYPISSAGLSNTAALDAAIVPPTVVTASLGSVVQQLLDESADLLCVLVDVTHRVVRAKFSAIGSQTGIVPNLVAATGAVAHQSFSKADYTKRASEFSADGVADFSIDDGAEMPLQRPIKPAKQTFTAASFVGAFEDATLEVGGELEGAHLMILLDQGDGKVTVIKFDTANNLLNARNTFNPLYGFDQTPTQNGGGTPRQKLE